MVLAMSVWSWVAVVCAVAGPCGLAGVGVWWIVETAEEEA